MLRNTLLKRALTTATINKAVVEAQYAVRGPIVQRADEIVVELNAASSSAAGGKKKYPFESVVMCNIGNPQALKQPPLTFYREVLSLLVNPQAIDKVSGVYNPESIARAKAYLKEIGYWTTTGAYTASKGYPFVRKQLSKWMTERDAEAKYAGEHTVHFDEFTLTNGASSGISLLLQALKGSGSVMIPVPQYPLYTATLALLEVPPVPYYLSEEGSWGLNLERLEQSIASAGAQKPSALVVINPGNPTGQVLDLATMKDILTFCHQHQLTLISDEVYQDNIYCADEGKVFHSFRKALLDMDDAKVRTGVQLASFHSTSKGVIGECGRRGGFMHLMNFPADVVAQLNKLQSIALCSNVDGQIMTGLMTQPPTAEALPQFQEEFDAAMASYKKKALTLRTALNADPTKMKCNPAEGAMYLFPQIILPEKFIAHASDKGYAKESADACWAMELLEEKGIVVVPGSGFGQNPGTYHFRTTILPQEHEIERCAKDITDFHNNIYSKYGN